MEKQRREESEKKKREKKEDPGAKRSTSRKTLCFFWWLRRKVECRADGLVPMHFAVFPLHLSKVLRLPQKSEARSYEVLHLSRIIIFPKLKI